MIKNAINVIFFLLQSNFIILYRTESYSVDHMTLEATLFTSFGLLLALMMRKSKPYYKIHAQYNLTIHPHITPKQQNEQEERQHEREYTVTVGMGRKKKNKNKKKAKKVYTQEIMIYPKISYTIQQMENDWRKKQQQKKMKCQMIGKEIQGMFMYFMDDLQTKLPYNGISGLYSLKIPIPGATYSIVMINIKFTQEYPLELPEIDIQTNNLVPLQKQKLFQIIKQHRGYFARTLQQFQQQQQSEEKSVSAQLDKNSQSRVTIKEQNSYIQCYYPYVLNVCISISQQLFYRQDLVIQYEENMNKKVQLSMIMDEQIEKNEKANLSANLNPNTKLNKVIETNKEIYQNILEEIFNQHDDEQKINVITGQKLHDANMPKYPNSRGRYKIDYEEIQMIGEGGFGRVYRCRNKIDSNIYAIKKMVINYNDPQSRKLLKEVALLSKLNHTNIVRYHQSWLQDTSSVDQLIADMSITDPQQIEQFNKIWKQYSSEHPSYEDRMINQSIEQDSSRSRAYPFKSEEDSVIFGEDIIFEADDSYDFGASMKGGEKIRAIDYEDSSSSHLNASIPNDMARKPSQVHEFPFKILYVVMQYCGKMTLKDFITKKFNEPNDIKIKLIRGILEGLAYIHSKRIIHRDLKPANIFLIDNSNKVKIGDFGLATVGNIENNPYEAEIIQYSEKTRGVGTTFYRAPQQLSSSSYDQKIDIYSLGIIMFELFFRFETNMERYQVLTKVTKTHKLPKQFSKIEQNSQFQQQIQSCISVVPQQRPTVQKLLQTFRNKYFTQLVSLIANPKHFQFYQLINHLFVIKNETNVLMKQNLFKNYLTEQFSRIYKIHRGVLFTPLSLIPVIDYETMNGIKIQTSRKEKFLLLSQRGVVMQYPSNTYVSWIRYAKETMKRNYKAQLNQTYKQQYSEGGNRQMRRFTFEKVAQFIGGDSKSQFSFKEKYVTAFDITYSMENGIAPYFLCQILKVSLLMIDTMSLTQKSPPIYLCNSLIFKCLALQHNVPALCLHKFLLSISDEKFRSMKNHVKLDYMKKFGIQGNIVKKIISLMERQEQNYVSFLKMCELQKIQNESRKFLTEQRQLTSIFEKIQQELKQTSDWIEVFELQSRIKWKLQIPPANTNGMFWNVGPIKGFASLEQYLPEQELCNLHLQTSLNPSSEEMQADVSILSNGQFLKSNIFKVASKCWQNNITVKWNDKIQSEKDLSCRINIILKKKHGKVYLMLRKNHMGLQKKSSESNQKDKEQKEVSYSFPLQNFNYQLLVNLIKENHKKSWIH